MGFFIPSEESDGLLVKKKLLSGKVICPGYYQKIDKHK
jgi:hypothetical protein